MNVNIICVGSIKEKFFREAVEEYAKRLSAYCKLSIIEVKDEKNKEKASERENEKVKEAEGKKILSKIKDNTYTIALAIDAKSFTSEEFADKLETIAMQKGGNVNFVIGGSLGLSKEVLEKADEKISFSKMTFPHQLMRVIFLEQLYRAYKISTNEPYHK